MRTLCAPKCWRTSCALKPFCNFSNKISTSTSSQETWAKNIKRPQGRLTMDAESEDQDQKPLSSIKPGSIKCIRLINFMCHEAFELNLGPKVNFIIGPNGSGKSALLTALVACLGGRASTTCRAKRASDFIMYGKRYAKVIITLHNYEKIYEKDQAFKPDDYGKTIVIEKIIHKDEPAARLVLKNDKDKKISERRQELDDMLEHFGICINNPICILNQEVSKTFLHSKKPEDKFDLFMKATSLEQIQNDYNQAELAHRQWGQCNDSKTVAFKLLDSEYASCREQAKFLENRSKMESEQEELAKLLVWAVARDNEHICKEVGEKIESISKDIDDAKTEIRRRELKIKGYDEDVQVATEKLQSQKELVDAVEKKISEARSKETVQKTKRIEVRAKIEQCGSKIARLKKDRASYEKTISETRKQLQDQNALDQDVELRKLDIARLEKEIETDLAREKSIRLHTDQLGTSMSMIRSDLQNANMRCSSLKNDLYQKNAVLRRLKGGQENELRKYGDFVIRIREEIENNNRQGKFKTKPIGPLGYYVKVKDPDVAGPLEMHLGRTAHAFICDNHQDRATLTNLFRKISSTSSEFKYPMIITRPFGKRHDVLRFKANHPVYKTLLDHVEIEFDAVFNALVDRNQIESVLYIPDSTEAENILTDPRLVPANTRCAYTKDCTTMHPHTDKTFFRSYAKNSKVSFVLFVRGNIDQIRQFEREVELLNGDLRDAEHRVKNIQDSLTAQRKEYDDNTVEVKKILAAIREKEEQLLNLKSIVTVQPQELCALETELASCISKIEIEGVELEKHRDTLKELDAKIEEIVKDKEGCHQLLKQREIERQATAKIIEDTKNNRAAAETIIRQQNIIVTNRQKDREESKARLDNALEKLARSKQSIPTSWDKPSHIDKTESIEEELRKIQVQLNADAQEERSPEEILASLHRRMKEIEESRFLKERNLDNHSLAGKTLKSRQMGFLQLRKNTVNAVASTFSSVMRSMRMSGELRIYMDDVKEHGVVVKKARTLEMNIDTHYAPDPAQRVNLAMNDRNDDPIKVNRRSQSRPDETPSRPKRPRMGGDAPNSSEKENMSKMTDTRSLSGGERSFSTVAFVLALWHHCSSPFKLLDEIDVFMDMVTRRVSYNALIRFAESGDERGQFIFFSPLELPKFENSGSFVKVFEMPQIVRKRPYSQAPPDEQEPPAARSRTSTQ